MVDSNLLKLLENEHPFEIATLLILSIVILGFPTYFDTKNNVIYSIYILIPYILLNEIANKEIVRDLIFRRRLINFEISLKKQEIKEEYNEMSKEVKEEIDKVDSKSNKLIKKYIINFILLILNLLLLLGNYSQIINFSIFKIQGFEIEGQFLVLIILLINLLNVYNSDKEISQLFVVYKDIYEKM
jgi:hypothetical protein